MDFAPYDQYSLDKPRYCLFVRLWVLVKSLQEAYIWESLLTIGSWKWSDTNFEVIYNFGMIFPLNQQILVNISYTVNF